MTSIATRLAALAALSLLTPLAALATEAMEVKVDTDAWDRALSVHYRDGGLDYAALAVDRVDLDAFLASLAAADPDAMGESERLAFWMNAYNGVVAYLVLERYPAITSVKNEDGFFDELRFRVAGKERTLDDLEGAARELDPRSHFAVVCASTSCPDLRFEAYRGERVEQQLEEQTRTFLGQDKGLVYDRDDNDLYLSSIFKWYAGDFTGGSTVLAFFMRGGLVDWITPHLPKELAAEIERRDPSVKYLDYDWSLNDRR